MSRVRGQIIEYVDGDELSLEVPAAPLMSRKALPSYEPNLLSCPPPTPSNLQEPPYRSIFLAFGLLVVGVVLCVCGLSVVTGYVDPKQ